MTYALKSGLRTRPPWRMGVMFVHQIQRDTLLSSAQVLGEDGTTRRSPCKGSHEASRLNRVRMR